LEYLLFAGLGLAAGELGAEAGRHRVGPKGARGLARIGPKALAPKQATFVLG